MRFLEFSRLSTLCRCEAHNVSLLRVSGREPCADTVGDSGSASALSRADSYGRIARAVASFKIRRLATGKFALRHLRAEWHAIHARIIHSAVSKRLVKQPVSELELEGPPSRRRRAPRPHVLTIKSGVAVPRDHGTVAPPTDNDWVALKARRQDEADRFTRRHQALLITY
ncbi:hypothetical protein PF005_g27099 [Phytophthora fragariae]|uniref:Uncharacterized protein n=1 Tax=Phytophthora fragariae TaxID=53985 RepID=A0A6A3VUW7_9STRA|nr:hypothetical protein PF009_g31695 [Phytophthora fragariae]KAE9158903.1 hypothetical protein PF004_g31726 [Phytophthora fragariae]KAE9171544.1 hypothetical protein PF005_g27099 [Phytophthora fragariae]KAE9263195.1 hypothetical protein PF008_g32421 [Phytophthora fragariae]